MGRGLLLLMLFASACASAPPQPPHVGKIAINLRSFHDDDYVCEGQPSASRCATVRDVLRFLGTARTEP